MCTVRVLYVYVYVRARVVVYVYKNVKDTKCTQKLTALSHPGKTCEHQRAT